MFKIEKLMTKNFNVPKITVTLQMCLMFMVSFHYVYAILPEMVERKLNKHKKLQSKQIESNVLILFINLFWFEPLFILFIQIFQAIEK